MNLSKENEFQELLGRLNAVSGGEGPDGKTIAMGGCFIMCWSKFELLCLGDLGVAKADGPPVGYQDSIANFVVAHISDGADFSPFKSAYDFFHQRYRGPLDFTPHFEALIDEDDRARRQIERIFNDEPNSTREKVRALLLVCYRLRGNLVHGNKWETGLADQVRNFTHASGVLLAVVERFR